MESISWPVLICTYPSAPSRQTWFTFLMHFLQLLWTPREEVNFRAMDTTSVTLRSKTDLLYSPNPVDFCFCQGCIWTRAFLQALQIFHLVPCIQEVQRKRQSLIFCIWWAWFWWYISLASFTLAKRASLYFSGCRIGPEMDSGITKRKILLGTNTQEKWHSLVLKNGTSVFSSSLSGEAEMKGRAVLAGLKAVAPFCRQHWGCLGKWGTKSQLLRNGWIPKARLKTQRKVRIFCPLPQSHLLYSAARHWLSVTEARLVVGQITNFISPAGNQQNRNARWVRWKLSHSRGGLSGSAWHTATKASVRWRVTIVSALPELGEIHHNFWWQWVNVPCSHALIILANKIYTQVAFATLFGLLRQVFNPVVQPWFLPLPWQLDSGLGLFTLAAKRGFI